MIVLVLTACPQGLRGSLTRWLLEISPGVFVGHVSARVRDALWAQTMDMIKDGKAIMVYPAKNEQGFEFKTHRHDWDLIDVDGIRLLQRPSQDSARKPAMRHGWSKASHYRRRRG